MSERMSDFLFEIDPTQPLTPAMFHEDAEEEPKPKLDPMRVTKWILIAFLLIAGLNLTPGYHALQERNRLSVQTPHSEGQEPR